MLPSSFRQRGAALIVLLVIIVLGALSLLLKDLRESIDGQARDAATTARALVAARDALIGWSVSHPQKPGAMPFPDRGAGDGNYDGNSDCVTSGLNDSHRLGRLAWMAEVSPCTNVGTGIDAFDGAGEMLWYAVSRNLLEKGGAQPINSTLLTDAPYPWLTVRDAAGNVVSDRVAVVLIAPGAALEGQARDGAAPGPSDYLEGVTIDGAGYDNFDSDDDFIMAEAGAAFNDRIAFITIDELMPKVERRVAGAVAVTLEEHAADNGGDYPDLVPFDDPESVTYTGQPGTLEGLLPVDDLGGALPAWLAANEWHKLIYVATATGATGACSPDCLTVDNMPLPDNDKRLVVIVAGAQLDFQDRAGSGDMQDYFEGENEDGGDTFERNDVDDNFNDQVRAVP